MKLFFLFLFYTGLCAQIKNSLLDSLLNQDEFLKNILNQKDKYEIQVLYTQINRDRDNKPRFDSFIFNVDTTRYFYPASSIKLTAGILALQKLDKLKNYKINKDSYLRIDSAYSGQTGVAADSSSETLRPSIAQYIKKLFLVSDNDAFNRLYEFLGQRYLNEELWKRGFRSFRILHRLSVPLSPDENRHTNPFIFYKQGRIVYYQPAENNPFEYNNYFRDVLKGRGYISGDSLINAPKDFSKNNAVSVKDLQGVLKTLYFPESVPDSDKFDLKEDDYGFIYKYMSMLPRESRFPYYDTTEYKDNYVKFLMFGDKDTTIPKHIRIFNKIGMAYGYLVDNAYIVDFEKKTEFLLTAVIYVNEDGIFNDDKYEYDTIGLPFMGHLGRAIYNYEIHRHKENLPDLNKFKFVY